MRGPGNLCASGWAARRDLGRRWRTPGLAQLGGNIDSRPSRWHAVGGGALRAGPGSDRVRALGTGHSFSPIADTAGDQVCLADLPTRIEVDRERATVTVGAGVRFGELASVLHRAGLALRTLGSLPHISVAGACATGTHGSGDRCGTLASSVRAVELVRADGSLERVRRGDPDFPGSVLALGCAGIVTALTLDLVPTFDVRQWVYEQVPTDDLGGILTAAYSVSAFTSSGAVLSRSAQAPGPAGERACMARSATGRLSAAMTGRAGPSHHEQAGARPVASRLPQSGPE